MLLSALLLGCAAAPPPATPTRPPPTTAVAAAAKPVAAAVNAAPDETPDETFRYQPPLPAPVALWTPPPLAEVGLASGARALVLERHALPYAEVRVMVRRDARPANPALDAMLLRALLDRPLWEGGPALSAALNAAGAHWRFELRSDEIGFAFITAGSAVHESLGMLLQAMAQFDPTPMLFEQTQKRLIPSYELRERERRDHPPAPRARLLAAVDARLLPAGHRYVAPEITGAAVAKLKLADLTRWRAQTLSPDRLQILATGDVSPAALRSTMEAATRGWKAQLHAAPPRAPLARGNFLIEEEGATQVELCVALPTVPRDAPDYGLDTLVQAAWSQAAFAWLRKEISGDWKNGVSDRIERYDASYEYLAVALQPGDAPKAARGILDAIDRVAGGELLDDAWEGRRNDTQRFVEAAFMSNGEAQSFLSWMSAQSAPVDLLSRLYALRGRASRADVLAAARARLKRADARVVAVGAVGAMAGEMTAELEKLGLGKVTLVRARPAAAQGEKKR